MSWWRVASLIGVVLWGIVGLCLSIGLTMTLTWAWPNFVETGPWSQMLTWTAILAPIVGIVLAVGLEKAFRKYSLTAITTALVIQLLALFTPMLVT